MFFFSADFFYLSFHLPYEGLIASVSNEMRRARFDEEKNKMKIIYDNYKFPEVQTASQRPQSYVRSPASVTRILWRNARGPHRALPGFRETLPDALLRFTFSSAYTALVRNHVRDTLPLILMGIFFSFFCLLFFFHSTNREAREFPLNSEVNEAPMISRLIIFISPKINYAPLSF